MTDFTRFAGTANPGLAAVIVAELGMRLGACAIERFPDGETAVTRVVGDVRGRACLIIDDVISTGGTKTCSRTVRSRSDPNRWPTEIVIAR